MKKTNQSIKQTELSKPFKSIDDQIQLLKQRNVIIDNEKFAKLMLLDRSYYTIINSVQHYFSFKDNKFIKEISFDELIRFHNFLSSLSTILLKYILIFEQSLKTKIAYRIAEKYGSETLILYEEKDKDIKQDYLDCKFYKIKNFNKALQDIKKDIDRNKTKPIKHYQKKHNHIPPWILFTALSLGTLKNLFLSLKNDDQLWIAESLITTIKNENNKIDFIKRSIYFIHKYRNFFAHGNKMFNLNFIENNHVKLNIDYLKIISKDWINKSNKKEHNNDLEYLIFILLELLNKQDKHRLANELIGLFDPMNDDSPDNYDSYLSILGLNKQIKNILSKFIIKQ